MQAKTASHADGESSLISQRNVIPIAALTDHIAVLGKTGSGKTSTAKLLIEEVVVRGGGARVCILDPIKSDWWGLTSSADGKSAGLPFQILGGPHGHVPLNDNAGHVIGELVATGALPLSIIDMADFKAGGANRFFNAFAETLMRKIRGVLYLVIEEAHEFAPKERSGVGDENMAVYYAKKLATAGRSKGLRLVVCTQRVQALHNAVLGSCETLIVHRFTAPADQAPVLTWLKSNVAEKAERTNIEQSLRTLQTGQGWICSSAQPLELKQFPRIQTFDNSKTPDGSEAAAVVTAKVDTAGLRQILGDAVKEAEANDPKLLKQRIAELEHQVQIANKGDPTIDKMREEDRRRELDMARRQGVEQGIDIATTEIRGKLQGVMKAGDEMMTRLRSIAEDAVDVPRSITVHPQNTRRSPQLDYALNEVARAAAKSNGVTGIKESHNNANGLPPVQQRILNALAELQQLGATEPDRELVAFMSGYSNVTSKGFANAIGALNSAGLTQSGAGAVGLTPEGRDQARPPPRPRTPEELQERVIAMLGGASGRVLRPLIEAYPKTIPRQTLAEKAGYGNVTSKGFANAIGRLRSLGFLDYPDRGSVVAKPVLFFEGR